MVQPTSNNDQQLEHLRQSLMDGDLTPYEVFHDDTLTNADKLFLLLTNEIIGETGCRLLIRNMVCRIREDFFEPAHDYSMRVNELMKSTVDMLEQYGRDEITNKELARFLVKNDIVSVSSLEIDVFEVTSVCITLYHFIAGESAANDLMIYEEPEVSARSYAEAEADITLSIILDAVKLTYDQMLH